MRVEQFPAGYSLKDRFPNCRKVSGVEGGAVYFAEADGLFYVISDERTMADFLDEKEDADIINTLISVYAFATETDREQFIRERDKGWRCLKT